MNLRGISKTRVAVIGAGMTRLSCIDDLKNHGFKPTIFVKSALIGAAKE